MTRILEQELDGVAVKNASHLLLSLDNVTITYEESKHPVIENVTFHLHEGESVLFLGPSGCGKSTVAMLCAQIIPRSVEASVSGTVWRDAEVEAPGQIGYVFQDPDAQFCMLSVGDEIAFGLENQSMDRSRMSECIQKGLSLAGLHVPLDAPHATFSGGMKQKLAMACSMAMEPKVLILDEPTANLDPLSTRQVFDQIRALHDAGQTMIVIEHKFDALLPYIDRVVLFDRHGSIYRTGPTKEVIREEWAWLVEEGVVAPWKQSPYENPARSKNLVDQASVKKSSDSTNEQPAYVLENLTMKYGNQLVWGDISLVIPKGEFVAIVGPNGAGKSSLLQVLAGLQKPSSGTVEMLGIPAKQWKKQECFQATAYCFQNPEFQFIYERVGDELANRIVGEDVPAGIRRLLEEFGLAGTEQNSPFALSQGQKRRLSVAAMLREEHEIYLLDEPTFGQDARTQQAILDRLTALYQAGKTVILTTHDMDLVKKYASLVVVVADCSIPFVGKPVDLFERVDILRMAHLLDDVAVECDGFSSYTEASMLVTDELADTKKNVEGEASASTGSGSRKKKRPPIQRLHPAWLLVTVLVVSAIAMFANSLSQATLMFVLPVILMMVLAWMSPWRIAKLLSPFLLFYVLYIWSFAANAAVPTGTKALDFLWFHLSWYGVYQGLVLAFRMLGTVLFGILFVWNVDMTDLIVSLCKDFRLSPKFSYGTLAGLRVVPLFASEWTKLRQARQLRGKDAKIALMRPVTYAIPLLSQAIRMSERVAIAMEARGFYSHAAAFAKSRTFYREIPVKWWDFAFGGLMIVVVVVLLLVCS